MPFIKSSSELQRNFGAISDLAHETHEPIYITRNGEASLVVMDADAFDDMQRLHRQVLEHEMHVLDAYMQSEEELQAGKTTSYDDYRLRRAAARHGGDAA